MLFESKKNNDKFLLDHDVDRMRIEYQRLFQSNQSLPPGLRRIQSDEVRRTIQRLIDSDQEKEIGVDDKTGNETRFFCDVAGFRSGLKVKPFHIKALPKALEELREDFKTKFDSYCENNDMEQVVAEDFDSSKSTTINIEAEEKQDQSWGDSGTNPDSRKVRWILHFEILISYFCQKDETLLPVFNIQQST